MTTSSTCERKELTSIFWAGGSANPMATAPNRTVVVKGSSLQIGQGRLFMVAGISF